MSQAKSAPTKRKYPIPETRIASQLGVTRIRVVKVRNDFLKRGEHWERLKRVIHYTEKAADWVTKHFAPSLPKIEYSEPEHRNAVVIRSNFPNRKLILIRNGGEKDFIANVRNADDYVPGMIVEYKHEKGAPRPDVIGKPPKPQPSRSAAYIAKHYG